MPKLVTSLVSFALAAALVAGAPISAPAQQITVDGSTGMLPLARDLVEAFTAKNGSVPFELGRGKESDAAMRAVADGRIGIGLSSKELGDAERAAGLHGVEIARTAVVFAVHSSVTVPGLTAQQICDIYAGKIKNWKEIGGANLPILPLTRPARETDPQIVKKHLSCFKEGQGVPSLPKAGDMAKALAATTGAIGVTTMTFVGDSEGKFRALALNGTSPTAENIERGSYSMVRRFILVTKGTPTGPVAQFVAFVKSADGERVIRENKAVPVK